MANTSSDKAKQQSSDQEQSSQDSSQSEAQSLTGSGDTRVHVVARASIFDLKAGQDGYVQRTAEVEAAINQGLLETI